MCVCGGRAWTKAQLLAEHDERATYIAQCYLGPFDLYCAEDDEVLTEEEGWRVRGLALPVHDVEHDYDEWFQNPTLVWA